MILTEIRIKNFRSFDDQTIRLSDYTCLVGQNGAGKSTILTALNVFFRNSTTTNLAILGEEDFHLKDTKKPVEIILTFERLTAAAQEEFKAYFRQDKLIVLAKAIWNEEAKNAEVRQYGTRQVMEQLAPFFKAEDDKASAKDLKAIYQDLKAKYSELPAAATKDDMHQALRAYEEAHPEKCSPLESQNQFYGWSKGADKMGKYIQWVYVPAVKDASTEQDESNATALGQILARTIRAKIDFGEKIDKIKESAEKEYLKLLESNSAALDGLSQSLSERVREWTHSGTEVKLKWNYEENKSVSVLPPRARVQAGEDQFLGEMARLGHGLQRTILLSLLQELVGIAEAGAPTLLLGIEEPELYQHPPQARHMAAVLERLCQGNTQIVLTTHSPYFVSSKTYESVRMIRRMKATGKSKISETNHSKISKRVSDAMGEEAVSHTATMAVLEQIMQPSQNELFFTGFAIFVEGVEDIAYLATHFQVTNRWVEFRSSGCHFVVCGGKKNMSRMVAIAQEFDIPHFVIFDSDSNQSGDVAKKTEHDRDNGCILKLMNLPVAPIPTETIWTDALVMWKNDIRNEVSNGIGATDWERVWGEVRGERKFGSNAVSGKNGVLIGAVMEKFFSQKITSAVLENLGNRVLLAAKKASNV